MKFAPGQPVVCLVDPATFREYIANHHGEDRARLEKLPLPELDGVYELKSYAAPIDDYPAIRLKEFPGWEFEEACFRAQIIVEEFV